VVLTGTPTLRTPEGENVLVPGDAVCFPAGPEGAHKLTNATDEAVRLLMLSTMVDPDVSAYPDSGKWGIFGVPGHEPILFREASAGVDYYDGETS
jgi:uncharacterized cupin superfamily protein